MQQKFEGTTHDEILLFIIKKSHKAIFTLKSVDNATEHFNLITSIFEFMKKEDIKWIEFPIKFDPIMPPNAITFKNKFNDNLVCHIEDFVKFYFANIRNFIKLQHIYYSDDSKTNGWTVVKSPKKGKREKYDNLLKELVELVREI